MDVLALILTVAAMIMFLFAASGRELRASTKSRCQLVLEVRVRVTAPAKF
jgi:hypothetical protein